MENSYLFFKYTILRQEKYLGNIIHLPKSRYQCFYCFTSVNSSCAVRTNNCTASEALCRDGTAIPI